MVFQTMSSGGFYERVGPGPSTGGLVYTQSAVPGVWALAPPCRATLTCLGEANRSLSSQIHREQ